MMQNTIKCSECELRFAVPDYWLQTKKQDETTFFCPNGHKQYFSLGSTEVDQLRQERDRLKQRVAERDDQIDWQRKQTKLAKRTASAYKGQVTKIKKRVGKGSCPCCKRHFSNLEKHMVSKHPDYHESDNVVPLKTEAS